ncbi:hypothetical protein VHEMI02685 [[Torrubiella] hemipterigena]|uniref:Multicopper oxidase n=1 Tax=[Torrubiella] hemipterigena TaxID=1531966 RepID=A0A0A1SQG3_9HYPO|nr:hypothetical protein VHEMI02685 [[Torrubiella] hemipterigena]
MAPRDDTELEDQPFLAGGSPRRSNATPTPRRQSSSWKVAGFFLLVTITVFGLILIPFGIKADPNHPLEKGHGHDGMGMEMGHGHDAPAPKPEPEHKPEPEKTEHEAVTKPPVEVTPLGARLRDTSEYILDQAWDYHAAPQTREYKWTIANAGLNPDGIYRPMILINGQYPGPLIECNEGDTIVVNIDNKAINATSIHFHGLFQNGTNHMDGTVGITQCPIAPNTQFSYKFKVDGQSGTYWYHAHHSAQASDGLLGPLIIHSKKERELQKIDYDTDRIIMVQDHYHNLTSELLMNYLKSGNENDEPVPDNALINGRGVRKCADFPGWKCTDHTPALPTLDLEKDKRHRLRFINVGAFAEFQIQFDEHSFQVTEVDGTDIHPAQFHRLNILPGQRYSVILEQNKTASADTVWMRTRMVTHCFTTENKRLTAELNAVVRYFDAGSKPTGAAPEPKSIEWPEGIEIICRDLDIANLHPVIEHTVPAPTDTLRINASFVIGDWRLARGNFNYHSWIMNATSPSLHRVVDTPVKKARKDLAIAINSDIFDESKEYVMETSSVRTVDLTINNFDDGSHPFHLHGHKFYVMAIGEKGYPPEAKDLNAYLKEHKLGVNPLRRDTVTIQGYGWAIIRVVLDNPGMWAFHCHNAWHAEGGMLMQFLVQGDEVRKRGVGGQNMKAMCKLDGVTSGMRPDDGLWFGNFDD